jgi:cobaltochelatase CobT
MRVDLSKVASAAVDAALDDETPRRRLSAPKAIAAGAALALAARYAVSKAPSLPRLPALRDLSDVSDRVREHMPGSVAEHIPDIPEGLRERLADYGLVDDDGWHDDLRDEPDDLFDEDDEDLDEAPDDEPEDLLDEDDEDLDEAPEDEAEDEDSSGSAPRT